VLDGCRYFCPCFFQNGKAQATRNPALLTDTFHRKIAGSISTPNVRSSMYFSQTAHYSI
jgi:hypothetical protein